MFQMGGLHKYVQLRLSNTAERLLHIVSNESVFFLLALLNFHILGCDQHEKVTERYEGDNLILSVDGLDVGISPTHLLYISRNQQYLAGELLLKVDVVNSSNVNLLSQDRALEISRSLQYLPNGKRVTISGKMLLSGAAPQIYCRFTQQITLTLGDTLDVKYYVDGVALRGYATSYCLKNSFEPHTYRGANVNSENDDLGNARKLTFCFAGALPWTVERIKPTATAGINRFSKQPAWIYKMQFNTPYETFEAARNASNDSLLQNLVYDFSEIGKADLIRPSVSRKVVTLSQSILDSKFSRILGIDYVNDTCGIMDGDTGRTWEDRTQCEIDTAVHRLSSLVDVVQLNVSSPGYAADVLAGKLNPYISTAKRHGLKIAYQQSRLSYPGVSEAAVGPGHDDWFARKLQIVQNSAGGNVYEIVDAKERDISPKYSGGKVLDIANDDAVSEMKKCIKNVFQLLDGIDYLFFDEDSYQCWADDTIKNNFSWDRFDFATHFFMSPTYSSEALKSFRLFTENADERFPVLPFSITQVLIPVTLTDTLVESPDGSDLWKNWFAWREKVFADWLDSMAAGARAGAETSGYGDQYQGAIYFCDATMPFPIVDDDQRNHGRRLSGVNLDLILNTPNIKWIVIEEMAGNADLSKAAWQIDTVRNMVETWNSSLLATSDCVDGGCEDKLKKFGAFIVTDQHSNERNVGIESLNEQMRIVLNADPDMIVVHTAEPLLNRVSPNYTMPLNNGEDEGTYDQELARVWHEWRFGNMWEVPELVAPNTGEEVSNSTSFSWKTVPKASGYQVEFVKDVDSYFGFFFYNGPQFIEVSAPPDGSNVVSFQPSSLVPSGEYLWRVRAKFTVEHQLWGLPYSSMVFWGNYSEQRNVTIH